MNSSRILIVSGMHRCGTSFMANWLQQSGLYIGDQLAGATPSNIKGHFEDIDFLTWHEQVLKANNETMYMSVESSLIVPVAFREQAKHFVDQRNQKHAQWGVKQPRMSLFLEFWNELIPNANYLFMVREPAAVVNSILRREAHKFLYKNDASIGPVKREEYLQAKEVHAKNYESMYVLHCRRVLDYIAKYGEDRTQVVDFDNIRQSGDQINRRLRAWSFDFDLQPIEDVFSEKLLIADEEYLFPPDLLDTTTIDTYQALRAFVEPRL